MAPPVRIGQRFVEPRQPSLTPAQAAFVLRRSEREVRNRIRRGELAVEWAGRRRRVSIEPLAEELAAVGDALALEALAGLVEGRIYLPRTGAAPTLAAAVAAAVGA